MPKPMGRPPVNRCSITLGARVTPEMYERYLAFCESVTASTVMASPSQSDILRHLLQVGLEVEEQRIAAEAATRRAANLEG